ncbi:MAG: serine protease [Nitriliruptorales bacterium]|nr:serine protease [Nitriliruptorales bacterium]
MIEQTLPPEFIGLAEVQAQHEEELLAKENVVGVGLGHKWSHGRDTGEDALTVLVDAKVDPSLLSTSDAVPSSVDDVRTDVQEVGVIFAGTALGEAELTGDATRVRRNDDLAPPPVPAAPEVGVQALTQKMRPAMGGFSVGHVNVTAGTIATGCYDARPFPGVPSRYYLLSNNHVLANSNAATVGDPILQPGRADGGTSPADVIGRLSRFVPIKFLSPGSSPTNLVDAAIAEVPFHVLNRQIYYIGHVTKMYAAPTVNDIVQKTGRTTNYTTGRVQNINATVDVNYGGGRVARFTRQIITTAMSAGGDSGSLVTNLASEGVGLLFAGSATVTIVNHLNFVQALLGIRITER